MKVKRHPDDRPLTWHDLWFLEAAISLVVVGGIYVLIAQFVALLTPYLVFVVFLGIAGLGVVVVALYIVSHERRLGRRKDLIEPVSNIQDLTSEQKHSIKWDQLVKRM
ncbi:MAG: hypothetical protein ACFFCB_08330, partial [Candidatus Odinarchaeota archaeon]